jgi:hypothetical protein
VSLPGSASLATIVPSEPKSCPTIRRAALFPPVGAALESGSFSTKEISSVASLADPRPDREAAKKTLDERYALMRELFQKTPLAVNVAYVCWGEDALWARLGWERPTPNKKP